MLQPHTMIHLIWNIKAGFHATGIYPFLPSKLLCQIPSPSPEPSDLPASTPLSPSPFPVTVFTSSPIDLATVHNANSTLISIIHAQPAIETPVKKYFDCLVRTSKELWARNAILMKQKNAIEAVVTARHTHLSSKWKAIGDNCLITTAEKLQGIRAAEAKTKESKAKKRKVEKMEV